MTPIWAAMAGARIIDLSQPLHRGMPVSPNHPPFQMALMRRHGDVVRPDGSSAANEIIVTGGHVGTHIDALAHVSYDGRLHGGITAAAVQSNHGIAALGIDTVAPILCRGILLDVASVRGVAVLDPGDEMTPDDLEEAERRAGVEVGPGDAVLLRSGWARHWDDPDRFVGARDGAPGPGEAAARWLAARRIRVTGAETIAYEAIPAGAGHTVLPAHRILLVEHGIHIIEVMDLTGLAAASISEFGFVAAPLRISGGTGSPIRPLAVVDG